VKRTPDQALEDYPQLTVRAVPARRRPSPEAAPAEVAPLAQTPHLAAPAPAYLQAGPGLLIPAPLGNAADAEPLRITREFRWIDGRYTPLIVVRRGDLVLLETAEVAPQY